MNYTKALICKKIATKLSISTTDSSKILDSFLSIIKKNVGSNIVKITRFGSFEMKETPKRIGRNPKTKESYIIDARNKVTFKISNKLKNFLN
tara:strand:- start:244 stop:519 length:276 start_codon:yes stop_codon:yes gene_type:complete